jgi:hypothetical protein
MRYSRGTSLGAWASFDVEIRPNALETFGNAAF